MNPNSNQRFLSSNRIGVCHLQNVDQFAQPPLWASYQIRTIEGCSCVGNAGNVFSVTDFKGNRYLAIPACITTRASRHSRCMRNPQFYVHVSGKRPMLRELYLCWESCNSLQESECVMQMRHEGSAVLCEPLLQCMCSISRKIGTAFCYVCYGLIVQFVVIRWLTGTEAIIYTGVITRLPQCIYVWLPQWRITESVTVKSPWIYRQNRLDPTHSKILQSPNKMHISSDVENCGRSRYQRPR